MRQTEKNRKKTGNGNSKARDPRYDCLRAVSVMAIIMVHAMPVETVSARQWWFNSIMTPFLLSFVGIYFMLSGMFLLEHGTERIGEFYRKRFITVEFRFWSMALFTIVIMSMRTEWFCLSGSMPAGIWHRC